VSALHIESALAAGYALFLLLAAIALDSLARLSHRRTERFRTAGFTFHDHLDAWECPEGQHLPRVETDHERRLARYRGRAHVCNACPGKADCTDSETGREVVRLLDPWPHSEAGRFHRGIAVVMVGLGGLITAVALARHHDAADALALGTILAVASVTLVRLASAFRRTPAGFPAPAASIERSEPTQSSM
jgi:hypothetical protein